MDTNIRELERLAAIGDIGAAEKLVHYYERSGDEEKARPLRRLVALSKVYTRREWLKARLSQFTADYTGDLYFEENPEEVISEKIIGGKSFLHMIFEGVFPVHEAPTDEIRKILKEVLCKMEVDGDGMSALIFPKGEGYKKIAQNHFDPFAPRHYSGYSDEYDDYGY